uniref:Uncharacterized protein n=1 Tax=Emiliania huxleyi TaxID=2903 RepID=A0A6V2PET8_EMIHU
MGGGWAAWPRCWPTRWRAVVLCMFLALTATATLTAEQEEELVTLIDASASAVAHLPTTSRARDEIRLLHGIQAHRAAGGGGDRDARGVGHHAPRSSPRKPLRQCAASAQHATAAVWTAPRRLRP